MQNYITANFSFANIIPDHALGNRVWDTEGKEYIDLSGGIAVNALGHCHPALVQAITEQAKKLWHVSNIYTTQITQQLAEKLVTHTFADKVFFANSGAEANEAALKLARKYAFDQLGSKKNEIIACLGSFHGRTLFTVSVGGQEKYQQGFGPLPPAIKHIPFNDIKALKAVVNDNTCAIIIEPIQGESGVLPAQLDFLLAARELANDYQAALIFDEVQTGMGRTGRLFAYEHFDVIPDIMTSAKALGCGFPIGAMLANNQFASAFTAGSHGTTFGGNPLACAVADRAFDIINAKDTLHNVHEQNKKLKLALQKIGEKTQVFGRIQGMGLLLGCVLNPEYQGQSQQWVSQCLTEGLMVTAASPNVIRFAPGLLLNDEDLQEGMSRFESALSKAL